MSLVGTAEDDAHSRLLSELSALVHRLWTGGGHVQTKAMSNVRVLLAKKTERDVAEQRTVRGNAKCRSLLSSASQKKVQLEGTRGCGSGAGGRVLTYEIAREVGGKKSELRKLDTAGSLARGIKSASSSVSPGIVHGRATYSEKSCLVAVMEVTSLSTWQKDLSTKDNKYAPTKFPNFVIAHSGGMESEAKGCVMVKIIEPSC